MNNYVGHSTDGYALETSDVIMKDILGHDLNHGDLVFLAHPTGPGKVTQYLAQIIDGGTDKPIALTMISHYNEKARPLHVRSSHIVFYSDQYRTTHPALIADIFNQKEPQR